MLRTRHFLAALTLATIVFSPAAQSAPLRYHPKLNQEFAYKIEIVWDLPSEIETRQGIIAYKVTSTGKALWLLYEENLKTESKYKGTGPYRHSTRTPANHPPHGPFYQKNNKLAITGRGEVQILEGTSQLPCLLGNLSILPFEPLSEREERSWTTNHGATIIRRNNPHRLIHPFFSRYGNVKTQTAATESTTFTFQSQKDQLLRFQKRYTLKAGLDKAKFTMTGEGTWTFNQKLGVPEALNIKYDLAIEDSNIKVNIPVTVKYTRISDKAYADFKKEQKERQRKAEEEFNRKQAELAAPLSDEERKKILADLRSTNIQRRKKALSKLAAKTKIYPDPEIAKAIKPLLKHRDTLIRQSAEHAIANFSREFKSKIALQKAYNTIFPIDIENMGAAVTPDMSLPPGLIVAAKQHMMVWQAAKVIQNLGGGQFKIQFQGFHQNKIISWSELRLAPPELEQPFVSKNKLEKLYGDHGAATSGTSNKNSTNSSHPFRTWTDSTGTFKVKAKFLYIAKDTVHLKREKDGKEIKVPLARLCDKDREIVEYLQEMPKVTNPFE